MRPRWIGDKPSDINSSRRRFYPRGQWDVAWLGVLNSGQQGRACAYGYGGSQADLDDVHQVVGEPGDAALHRGAQPALEQVGHGGC